MGFLPPFRKNIPKNIKKKCRRNGKGNFFSDDSPRLAPREDACVSFRFTPSREGCARSTTRPLDETARYFHAKDPRGSMETRPRAFSDGIRPSECVCYAFLFRFKKCNSRTRTRKSGRSQFSLPNGFFPVKRVQQQQQKKRAEKPSSFFESALESARRPSFSSSREGGFFGCRFAVSSDEVNSSPAFFLLLALSKTVPKKRGKNVTVDI